jgi:hypothetical protein
MAAAVVTSTGCGVGEAAALAAASAAGSCCLAREQATLTAKIRIAEPIATLVLVSFNLDSLSCKDFCSLI